jgi:hypothetical protein
MLFFHVIVILIAYTGIVKPAPWQRATVTIAQKKGAMQNGFLILFDLNPGGADWARRDGTASSTCGKAAGGSGQDIGTR